MSSSPSKTVLVTGGNGYLGSAVVQHFLQHHYRVHTTVRSLAKADGLKSYLSHYASSLSVFVVADMTQADAYHSSGALAGVDAVCHVASPIPDVFNAAPADADYVRDIVEPAIQGNLAILRAATSAPHVKHVILTSSIAACLSFANMHVPRAEALQVTEASWNEDKAEDNPQLKTNAYAAYTVSKACAERAAWAYMQEHQPAFVLATFCPPYFFGPAAIVPRSQAEFGSTSGVVYRMLKGEGTAYPLDGSYCDVRDIALAFRLTIEKPLQQSERFVLSSGGQTTGEIEAFVKSLDPHVLEDRPTGMHTEKVREMLGWKPRAKRETFVDMAAYLREAEKAFAE